MAALAAQIGSLRFASVDEDYFNRLDGVRLLFHLFNVNKKDC